MSLLSLNMSYFWETTNAQIFSLQSSFFTKLPCAHRIRRINVRTAASSFGTRSHMWNSRVMKLAIVYAFICLPFLRIRSLEYTNSHVVLISQYFSNTQRAVCFLIKLLYYRFNWKQIATINCRVVPNSYNVTVGVSNELLQEEISTAFHRIKRKGSRSVKRLKQSCSLLWCAIEEDRLRLTDCDFSIYLRPVCMCMCMDARRDSNVVTILKIAFATCQLIYREITGFYCGITEILLKMRCFDIFPSITRFNNNVMAVLWRTYRPVRYLRESELCRGNR